MLAGSWLKEINVSCVTNHVPHAMIPLQNAHHAQPDDFSMSRPRPVSKTVIQTAPHVPLPPPIVPHAILNPSSKRTALVPFVTPVVSLVMEVPTLAPHALKINSLIFSQLPAQQSAIQIARRVRTSQPIAHHAIQPPSSKQIIPVLSVLQPVPPASQQPITARLASMDISWLPQLAPMEIPAINVTINALNVKTRPITALPAPTEDLPLVEFAIMDAQDCPAHSHSPFLLLAVSLRLLVSSSWVVTSRNATTRRAESKKSFWLKESNLIPKGDAEK